LAAAGIDQIDGEEAPPREITVLLLNYVPQATRDLAGARKRASAVFQHPGVSLDWHACGAEDSQVTDDPTCQQVVSPEKIQLRIVHRFKSAPGVADRDTMGFAIGDIATVSVGKIEEFRLYVSKPRPEVFGYAIAYEIGHVLLHQAHHSPVGIMRAYWSHEDIELAGAPGMAFTPEEANVIRADIQASSMQVQAMQLAFSASAK
jgi:hypothetical protein